MLWCMRYGTGETHASLKAHPQTDGRVVWSAIYTRLMQSVAVDSCDIALHISVARLCELRLGRACMACEQAASSIHLCALPFSGQNPSVCTPLAAAFACSALDAAILAGVPLVLALFALGRHRGGACSMAGNASELNKGASPTPAPPSKELNLATSFTYNNGED